jgi:hypothetical protein
LEIKGVPESEIEDLATLLAPIVSYFFDLLRDAYEDFPGDELAWTPAELAPAPA